jgi:PhnB protein
MELTAYLNFRGDCEAAFSFYERCLGARIGPMFRYGGSPMEKQAPAGWRDKIMHGSLTIGSQTLNGADVSPDRYEEAKGFSLSLQMRSEQEAERVFEALAQGGRIVMPLEKTFWAARFGMVVDRFGIPWMVNCEGDSS